MDLLIIKLFIICFKILFILNWIQIQISQNKINNNNNKQLKPSFDMIFCLNFYKNQIVLLCLHKFNHSYMFI
jgi:hypothetical protein